MRKTIIDQTYHMNMTTEKELDDIYSKIFKDQILKGLIEGSLTFSVLGIIALIALIYDQYSQNGFAFWTYIGIGFFVGFIFLLFISKKYRDSFKISNHSLIFKEFYDFYRDLKDEDLENIKNIKKDIEFFADRLEGWVYSSAPIAFQELPKSISNNLKEHIIKIFESKEKDKIEIFSDYIFRICVINTQRDLTNDEWIDFSKNLVSISTGKKPSEISIKLDAILIKETSVPLTDKIPKQLKNPLIPGAVIGILLFILGYVEEEKLNLTLLNSAYAFAAVSTPLKIIEVIVKITISKKSINL